MKHCRKYILPLLAASLFYAAGKFSYAQTDGFQIVKIISSLPSSPEWEIGSPTPGDMDMLRELFSKPFHYLDCGGQCYAFISEDRKIVLKLFKMHHLRQYPLLHKMPMLGALAELKAKFLLFQKQRLERVFSSCKIAYSELKSETGLIYLNLNQNEVFSSLHPQLVDKLGITHRVNLAKIPFVLQYRADNAFKELRVHLRQNDIEGGKKVIREILDYLKARYQKGIKDLDPSLRRNLGLLENRAIAIDIGGFFHSSTSISIEEAQAELARDTRRMRIWLEKRSPELTNYFDSLVHQ